MRARTHAEQTTVPAWMPIFLSLMLVLLTLFIFLSTFTESDYEKVRIFKENFRKNFILKGRGVSSAVTVVETGSHDPLQGMLDRLKSEKLDLKLLREYLKVAEIRALGVKDVSRGVSLTVGVEELFAPDGSLSSDGERRLAILSYLVRDLPYLVELTTFGSSELGYAASMERAFRHARTVYRFLLDREVHPVKVRIACRVGSKERETALELAFKEPEL